MNDPELKPQPKSGTFPAQRKSIFSDGPAASSTGGEGMDRQLEKKKWPPKKIALIASIVIFVALVAYGFSTTTGGKRLNVDREKLTFANVEHGVFQELISVNGNAIPAEFIYLDAVEGGRVEEVFVQEGAMVNEGEPILRLSNNSLEMSMLTAEASRIEQTNRLETLRFQMVQNALSLRQQLSEVNYQITRLDRMHRRNQELYAKQLISDEEYEQIRDQYDHFLQLKRLTLEGFRADSLQQITQMNQMTISLQRIEENFRLVEQNLENLTLRAPISGRLTQLNAEIGEIRNMGFRFGQIDNLDGGYQVEARIDEFYSSRVNRGQRARGEHAGIQYDLVVTRVYPEVRDGSFTVDLDFESELPPDIRRGLTLRFRLEMSDPAEADLIPRGGFYQTTGGNWIYIVDSSGDFAVKRYIRLGRQNPQHFEVLEGLQPGEEVVTSSYDTFGDADRLVFN